MSETERPMVYNPAEPMPTKQFAQIAGEIRLTPEDERERAGTVTLEERARQLLRDIGQPHEAELRAVVAIVLRHLDEAWQLGYRDAQRDAEEAKKDAGGGADE